MGGGAEHAPQRRRVGAGADAQAQAPGSPPPGLGEGPPGVGLAVAALVAVVVGEAVRQHDQQPPGRPALASSTAAPWRMAAPSRVYAPGTRPSSRCAARPSSRSSKRFTGSDLDRLPTLGPERVQRDAVAEVVQRRGERRRRRPLVLVHGAARRCRLAGRARDVEQDQHRQVAPAPQALDVDAVVGRRARPATPTRASTAASMSMSSP